MTTHAPDHGHSTSPPASLLRLLQDLLKPDAPEEAAPGAGSGVAARRGALLAFAISGLALYGATGGLFQGGAQLALSALKAPLIVLLSLALCTPAFVVLTALEGESWSAGRILDSAVAFLAVLALALLGLLPVAWLFSVASRHLTSVVLLHLAAWVVALALARRALRRAAGVRRRGAFRAWILLLFLVSLQAATYLQPVLWRLPDQASFPRPRQLFFEHFSDGLKLGWPRTPPATGTDSGAEAVTPPEERR
jgi:hypothetical protein